MTGLRVLTIPVQRLAHRHSDTCQRNDWTQTVVPGSSDYGEQRSRPWVCRLMRRGVGHGSWVPSMGV